MSMKILLKIFLFYTSLRKDGIFKLVLLDFKLNDTINFAHTLPVLNQALFTFLLLLRYQKLDLLEYFQSLLLAHARHDSFAD